MYVCRLEHYVGLMLGKSDVRLKCLDMNPSVSTDILTGDTFDSFKLAYL